MSDIPQSLDQNAPTVVEPDTLDTNPSELINRDPFYPSRLRIAQNFGELAGVKKTLTTVPVRKPSSQDFVRVHPDESYRLPTAVLELKEERETYLVDPAVLPDLSGEFALKMLFTTLNRQGGLTLWPGASTRRGRAIQPVAPIRQGSGGACAEMLDSYQGQHGTRRV